MAVEVALWPKNWVVNDLKSWSSAKKSDIEGLQLEIGTV